MTTRAVIREYPDSVPVSLVLRHDSDGRWRWFESSGADTEISGKTKSAAIAAGRSAWRSWGFKLKTVRRNMGKRRKAKKLMKSGSKKLAAWVRSQGKKNPRGRVPGVYARRWNVFDTGTVSEPGYKYLGYVEATTRAAAMRSARRQFRSKAKGGIDVEGTTITAGNPASVKLPRSGHTGFLKAKAVDVITRGGKVVEVRVKR